LICNKLILMSGGVMMNSLVDNMLNFYNELRNINHLKEENVTVLNEFINNEEFIRRFYEKYVDHNIGHIKVVMCGINPGRYGAGKTGIPFVDFNSLSELLSDVNRKDSERSAEFFYSIIKNYGAKKFYSNIYVTNICSIGFEKDKKNYNYYQLPKSVKDIIYVNFLDKMKIISPNVIIPLSKYVEDTLKYLKSGVYLEGIEIENRLNHPYYCSIKTNWENQFKKYVNKLDKYFL
uniref:uracil-DNA glycosylase family protein n=1 Tax=Clostridium beijerinckii TaxID=1520 RepID=UPI0022E3F48C